MSEPSSDGRPRLLVSRCLGFEPCRYNGGIIASPPVQSLARFVGVTTVCPEVAIGLGVPRPAVRLVDSGGRVRLIQPETGREVTEAMERFVGEFLGDGDPAYDGAVLKAGSPSCGFRDVKVYASGERGSSARKGAGAFGGSVIARWPFLPVEDEGRLRNRDLREHFLTRLFAQARLRGESDRGGASRLVRFHARHKLLLMGHSQAGMRELGRVVAEAGRGSAADAWEKYALSFVAALSRTPRRGSVVNVLLHAFGYVSERLSPRERSLFLRTLDEYRAGRIPLSVPLRLMQAWVVRFDVAYLADQVFFEPYPLDLLDEADSGKGRDVQ